MEGVKIISLEKISDNERGRTFQFDNRDSDKLLLLNRKKGTISGGHYHTGKNKMKDPEIIMLIDGEAKFTFRNVKTKEEVIETYKEPVMFRLDPYIFHEIEAITDIIFIDMNSIDDDNDTIRSDKILDN